MSVTRAQGFNEFWEFRENQGIKLKGLCTGQGLCCFTLLILCDVNLLLNKTSGIKGLDPLNIPMLVFLWLKKENSLKIQLKKFILIS